MAGRTWPFGVICALLTALPCAGRAGEPDADGHAMNAGHAGCPRLRPSPLNAEGAESTEHAENDERQASTAHGK